MDASLYTNVLTTRGINYSVFYDKGSDASKETLLFLHGFPSSSYDWRHQVAYFKARGHSIIVPDMLGYGNTDKPTDAEAYARSLVAKDIIDVLDAVHGEQPVVVVGHDWWAQELCFELNTLINSIAGVVPLSVVWLMTMNIVSWGLPFFPLAISLQTRLSLIHSS